MLGLHLLPKRVHEIAAPKDSFVGGISLSPATEFMNRRPPSRTPNEPSALQLGPATQRNTRGHESLIPCPGLPHLRAEVSEDRFRGLPGACVSAYKGTMPTVAIRIQFMKIGYYFGPQGIQMEVAH